MYFFCVSYGFLVRTPIRTTKKKLFGGSRTSKNKATQRVLSEINHMGFLKTRSTFLGGRGGCNTDWCFWRSMLGAFRVKVTQWRSKCKKTGKHD